MKFADLSPKEASGGRKSPRLSPSDGKKRDSRISRLKCLLSGCLDHGEAYESLQKVPEHALRRYSGKFFTFSRNLMENMESRHGWGAKRAFAKFLSEAVQNEAFSEDYDGWLRCMDSFARELGAKTPIYIEAAMRGCAKFAAKCGGTRELRSASGQILAYCNSFGHPGNFIDNVLAPLVEAGASAGHIDRACSATLAEMKNASPEKRLQILKDAEKSVEEFINS